MTQLEYDVTEYVVLNREEIRNLLAKELSYLHTYSSLFSQSPDIYHDYYKKVFLSKLTEHMITSFNSNYEDISQIIDIDFANRYVL